MERKLTAILSADVAGYSRLMEADEVGTLHTLTAYRAGIDACIAQYRGRIVGTAGDSVLAEFASAVDAAQCAVEIQQTLKAKNGDLPPERKMEFRIGLNVGDVMAEGEQIYGDGVNVAARLQGLADVGGIFISGTVYDQIENKLGLHYEYLGEQEVKNITKPVRVWRVRWEEAESSTFKVQRSRSEVQRSRFNVQGSTSKEESPKPRRMGTPVFVLVSVLLLGGLVILLYPSLPPLITRHSSLITQEAQPPLLPSLLPLPDKPSIVVLPFVNMSKDPEQEYFSDGLTEDLTSDLTRISSLFVIARNSAFTYKGKAVKVQDVGREMGVRYVLEGSVRRADNQVRIVAQLIDATTGGHLWSERYDRPLKDIFALQDEIVQKIVTTLKLQLTVQERGYLVRKHTDNLEAYDAFLRGVEYFGRYAKETNVQARQLFEKALALDPQYAEAYVWLGRTYTMEWGSGWSTDPQTLERAFELEQKAVALDDSLPLAHSVLSFVYAQKQQYDQALAEGKRAMALDANNADSYAWQASVLNLAGRPEEALRLVEQAMRLNPRHPPFDLGTLAWAYCLTGRYAEAVATAKEFLSRSPNHPMGHLNLAVSSLLQWASQQSADSQTLAQGLAAAQRVLALNDSDFLGHVTLGTVYLWQKQYEQSIAELERAIALDPNWAVSYASLAEVLSRVGRSEEALQMVEQALHHKAAVVDFHLANVGTAYSLAGRPEEAIAPLKQYLTRYPNILGPHVTLTAVYSELGKEAEARVEAAEVLRINPTFSLEVHRQRAPIKDPAALERHLAALRKAGLK
jgi:TolB-like protein/class 3 adenylate cyclase/predicted Zn-dependent protease